jgi:hypothetical protein
MMRSLLTFLLVVSAGQASAQTTALNSWQPAAGYVTAGQDEPGYRRWIMQHPTRSFQVASFHRYLSDAGVGFVVPTWQLLRTASQWQRCGAQPFEVPPLHEWANVVQTLRYVRDHVVPIVGPVEPVSAYRNPALNHCAGGARESVHQHLSAMDLVPLYPISRGSLISRLCAAHLAEGPRYSVGLGFYTKYRFHVDTWKFRTWGSNDSGSIACAASYALAHAPPPPPISTPQPLPVSTPIQQASPPAPEVQPILDPIPETKPGALVQQPGGGVQQ